MNQGREVTSRILRARKAWDKHRAVASSLLGLPAQPWDMLTERARERIINELEAEKSK